MANFALPDFKFELDSIEVRTGTLTSTFTGEEALASAVNHLRRNCGILRWTTAWDLRMDLTYRLKYGSWSERGLTFALPYGELEFVEA